MGFLTILVLSFTLIGIGFLGCFIHKFPGPILAFLGMLLFIFGSKMPSSIIPWAGIIISAIAIVATMIANKKIPLIAQKVSEFGNAGKWGAIVGSIIGLLVMIGARSSSTAVLILIGVLSLVVIPFCFSWIFEAISRKDFMKALMPGLAAFLTYFLSMILKLAVCIFCLYIVIANMADRTVGGGHYKKSESSYSKHSSKDDDYSDDEEDIEEYEDYLNEINDESAMPDSYSYPFYEGSSIGEEMANLVSEDGFAGTMDGMTLQDQFNGWHSSAMGRLRQVKGSDGGYNYQFFFNSDDGRLSGIALSHYVDDPWGECATIDERLGTSDSDPMVTMPNGAMVSPGHTGDKVYIYYFYPCAPDPNPAPRK